MIYCTLHGRLGNNLFSIANGLSLAKRLKTDLALSKMSLAGHRNSIPVDLSIFNYKFNQIDIPKLKNIYNEPHIHYTPIDIQNDTIVSGVFGSWKYFENIKEELINEYFTPSLEIKSKLDQYDIPHNALGISIRRGDFLMLQQNHCVLTPEYYQEAINTYFQNNIDSIYIFSDDIEWCKNIFGNEVNYVEDSVGVQLFLMTKMKHFIMSNSTFAWWGIYLNQNKGIIIAPDPWLGPSYDHENTDDIYYPTWIKHKHTRVFQEYTMNSNFFN